MVGYHPSSDFLGHWELFLAGYAMLKIKIRLIQRIIIIVTVVQPARTLLRTVRIPYNTPQ